MNTKNIDDLIAVNEFCINHNIEISFINLLQQSGLVDISYVKSEYFVRKEQLSHLEKYIRFYYEMDINLEGIETISYLLKRIENLQNEIIILQNNLHFFDILGEQRILK